VINASSNIAMVVTGAGKADAVYSALEKSPNADKLPIQKVNPEGEIKWFLDKGAASRLYR
jgi:6-phosphogluconolactonase